MVNDDALEIPAGMRHFELPAGEETLDFHGRLLGSVDNDRGDRPRWAELRLYKILSSGGEEMWLLYTVGHTMIYHAAGAECNKGIAVRAGDFPQRAEDPDGLEPCTTCAPPDWQDADGEELFELEVTWYTYTPCPTADKVLDALRREPRCKHCAHKPHEGYRCGCACESYEEAPRTLSVPGRRLVEHVKHRDPEIAKAAARRVKF